MELQKLTKQNAIKKTNETKTAVMIRGVKAPDRSQVMKLDYALWCRQEEVIRNVSNVTEMSEMSPLVVWKDYTIEVEDKIHMTETGNKFKLSGGEWRKEWWNVWVQIKDQWSKVDAN